MKQTFEKISNWIKNYINPPSVKGKKMSPLFILLVSIGTAAMLISNVAAAKTFSLFGLNIDGYGLSLPVAVIIFPITYILSDLFSEVYGYVWSRRTCWINFSMNLLMVIVFQIAILIPGTDKSVNESFKIILGATPLTFVAGLVAYICGDFLNDVIFQKMKERSVKLHKNSGWAFWIRSILSSFVGECIDSSIFLPILYVNLMLSFGVPYPPFWAIIVMILIQASIKTLYEIIISPVTYIITKRVKKYELKFN